MTTPESRIRVHITDNFEVDGVQIFIALRHSESEISVIKFDDHGRQTWVRVDGAVVANPSMVLNNDFARALLDALLRHYQGASDMHTLRSDYLHERGRVDRMIDTIAGITSTIIRHSVER